MEWARHVWHLAPWWAWTVMLVLLTLIVLFWIGKKLVCRDLDETYRNLAEFKETHASLIRGYRELEKKLKSREIVLLRFIQHFVSQKDADAYVSPRAQAVDDAQMAVLSLREWQPGIVFPALVTNEKRNVILVEAFDKEYMARRARLEQCKKDFENACTFVTEVGFAVKDSHEEYLISAQGKTRG